MSVLTGQLAPAFTAHAVLDGSRIVDDFSLDQYIGKKYVVLFFYPKDFTFVCPTELHAFQERLADFASRDTVVVACSTDSAECHHGWLRLAKAEGGIQGITYPLIADTNKTISSNFDVLDGEYDYDEEGELVGTSELICNRGLFLIDKEGVVQHQVVNNKPLGRSVDEALRMVDALRHFEAEGEVCPANWNSGSKAMTASFEGVADYLAAH
jgi:peroxiredoxin 2/4